MPGISSLLLIPEPSWQDITGLEAALKELNIPNKRGSLEALAPAITPFNLASLRTFLDGNKLETVNDPTPVEVDYETRLWDGKTKSLGALYHGPGYCAFISNKFLENGNIEEGCHPVVITPRILVDFTDRVHARTFYAFWPTVVSEGGMRAALAKDQPPLSKEETAQAMVRNILSSLLHAYHGEPFCSDENCFHSNPHTISDTRKRNEGMGCELHERLLKDTIKH